MTDKDADLLRTFIASEDKALSKRKRGSFWPANHHRIGPLANRASGLLKPDERRNFYFHYMRVGRKRTAAKRIAQWLKD
ncbi:hypothetical protein TH25_05900 [Thalassospira profundimaris]|uniref:Uncharacterized protein n=1 Tax=Thalassospira profundimaris TaxID=502049 RepID=A0A367XHG2_9PROT|nr:hypothetical protein [Thalassospira profundimaris]RCK52570.1 hypothetical protein TH25_05900 [Thalassospira profundimaris]